MYLLVQMQLVVQKLRSCYDCLSLYHNNSAFAILFSNFKQKRTNNALVQFVCFIYANINKFANLHVANLFVALVGCNVATIGVQNWYQTIIQ